MTVQQEPVVAVEVVEDQIPVVMVVALELEVQVVVELVELDHQEDLIIKTLLQELLTQVVVEVLVNSRNILTI